MSGAPLAATALGGRTCAIDAEHAVTCFGQNRRGLFVPGRDNILTPTKIGFLGTNVAAIGAGTTFGCIRTTAGSVACFGENQRGTLGVPTPSKSERVLVNVPGLQSDVAGLAVGDNHACAWTNAGKLTCWGSNGSGQLGNGAPDYNEHGPLVPLGLGADVTEACVGVEYTCARKTDGSVWCFGYGSLGQLGIGLSSGSATPVQVESLVARQISCEEWHACAVDMAGVAWCWGNNTMGEITGDSANTFRTPKELPALPDHVARVYARMGNTFIATTKGDLYAMGRTTRSRRR